MNDREGCAGCLAFLILMILYILGFAAVIWFITKVVLFTIGD